MDVKARDTKTCKFPKISQKKGNTGGIHWFHQIYKKHLCRIVDTTETQVAFALERTLGASPCSHTLLEIPQAIAKQTRENTLQNCPGT